MLYAVLRSSDSVQIGWIRDHAGKTNLDLATEARTLLGYPLVGHLSAVEMGTWLVVKIGLEVICTLQPYVATSHGAPAAYRTLPIL